MKLEIAASQLEAIGNPTRLHLYRILVRAGATLTGERRTKAQVIDHALRELDIHADPDLWDHVIMVGDRDHDVLGALQHHIPCIGVLWGYGSVEELLKAGAVALAESPFDVVGLAAQAYRWPDS